MGYGPFKKPIYLRLSGAGNFKARNALEALDYLEQFWPHAGTAHFLRAQVMCRAAVEGTAPSELARLAVVDAAQRAGVLAAGWQNAFDQRNERAGRMSGLTGAAAW